MGYLIGLALPLYPQFDLPLAFLVVLATLAAALELSFLRAWVTIILFTSPGLLTTISRSAKRAGAC